MKSGTGDDPFADEPADDESDDKPTDADQTMDTTPDTTTDESGNEPQIPYVLERTTVKGNRDEVRQFFLREEAAEGERQLKRDLEDELGKDVRKLDLREAAYLVAQRHPEEVAEELREWGYEYL